MDPGPRVARLLSDRPLGDDARILPAPLVLDDTEYRTRVMAGVAQRARALHGLFADLVLGSGRWLTADVGLNPRLLDDILAAEGTSLPALRHLWRGHPPAHIRFVYGPDLVRAADGRWMVLEDNVGCVGGSADAHFVVARYRAAMSLPSCPTCLGEPDLAVALAWWLRRIGREAARVVSVLGCQGGGVGPHVDENSRRRIILSDLGIPLVERARLAAGSAANSGPLIVVNFDVDDTYRDVFSDPDTAMVNAPGTGVLGNKAFLPVVDGLIRVTTGEPPILSTPTTRLLDGELPPDPQDWVVKSTTGCQGTEVVLLGPDSSLEQLSRQIRLGPARAVLQRYVEPSRLTLGGHGSADGYRIEIRPICYVLDDTNVHVSEIPVGKAISVHDTRRLNNISQGAQYVPVLREPCLGCAATGR